MSFHPAQSWWRPSSWIYLEHKQKAAIYQCVITVSVKKENETNSAKGITCKRCGMTIRVFYDWLISLLHWVPPRINSETKHYLSIWLDLAIPYNHTQAFRPVTVDCETQTQSSTSITSLDFRLLSRFVDQTFTYFMCNTHIDYSEVYNAVENLNYYP